MKRFFQTVGPLLLAILLFQLNGGMSSVVAQTTTKTTAPPTTGPPTTAPPSTHPPATTGDESPTTVTKKEGNGVPVTSKPRKRPGKLAKTGPGDDAGEFRLILFNGGFVLLMIGAIFFAVKRRVERRYWWNMSSKM